MNLQKIFAIFGLTVISIVLTIGVIWFERQLAGSSITLFLIGSFFVVLYNVVKKLFLILLNKNNDNDAD